jgi:hypothetical protein
MRSLEAPVPLPTPPAAHVAVPVDAEEDPLDAYMNSLAAAPLSSASAAGAAPSRASTAAAAAVKSSLALDDEDDAMLSYVSSAAARLEARAADQGVTVEALQKSDRKRRAQDGDDDDGDARDGGDDTVASRRGGADIDALAPIDHEAMQYAPFMRSFYSECAELASLPASEIAELMLDLDLVVSGSSAVPPPRLCYRWSHFGFDARLLAQIAKQGFEQPTPIQSQAIPVILSGCDLIGIARTGSGKTVGQSLR